jgi:branched-chain amino acid transport system permease protein
MEMTGTIKIPQIAVNAVGILLIAAILLCPFVAGSFWLFFFAQMIVASYVAVSFNLAYSYGRVLSFAQGSFFGLGAYVALYLASSNPWSLPLIVVASVVMTAVVGAFFGAIFVRMSGHNPTIATVILASAGLLAANALGGVTGSEDGLGVHAVTVGAGALSIHLGPTKSLYYLLAIPLVCLLTAWHFVQQRDFWKVVRAVASNELRAQQLGYNVRVRKLLIFAVSAGISGLGGAFYALLMRHVSSTTFDIGLSVNAILYAVVGGTGTIFGPLLGVFVIYPMTEIIAHYFLYVQIVIGAVLIFTALVMPKGILGTLFDRTRS